MSKPLFTQKHYEYLEAVLGQCTEDCKVIGVLADALAKDNPNFRRGVFLRRVRPCHCDEYTGCRHLITCRFKK